MFYMLAPHVLVSWPLDQSPTFVHLNRQHVFLVRYVWTWRRTVKSCLSLSNTRCLAIRTMLQAGVVSVVNKLFSFLSESSSLRYNLQSWFCLRWFYWGIFLSSLKGLFGNMFYSFWASQANLRNVFSLCWLFAFRCRCLLKVWSTTPDRPDPLVFSAPIAGTASKVAFGPQQRLGDPIPKTQVTQVVSSGSFSFWFCPLTMFDHFHVVFTCTCLLLCAFALSIKVTSTFLGSFALLCTSFKSFWAGLFMSCLIFESLTSNKRSPNVKLEYMHLHMFLFGLQYFYIHVDKLQQSYKLRPNVLQVAYLICLPELLLLFAARPSGSFTQKMPLALTMKAH